MREAIIFVVTIFCFLAAKPISASDSSKLCANPSDPSTILVCNLSREFGISPLKVGTGMVLASVQMTGTFCQFNFSRKFLDWRIKTETDQDIAAVVRHLVTFYRDKSPPGFNGDKKVFCTMQYQTFGPRSNERLFD